MNAILILAHGSRATETEKTLDAVVEMVRKMLPDTIIEAAYMEFGRVNITVGLDNLIERGAEEIKVIPYFLFDGMHIRQDIPDELGAYMAAHSGVKVTLGRTLGADIRLAEILRDRILTA